VLWPPAAVRLADGLFSVIIEPSLRYSELGAIVSRPIRRRFRTISMSASSTGPFVMGVSDILCYICQPSRLIWVRRQDITDRNLPPSNGLPLQQPPPPQEFNQ